MHIVTKISLFITTFFSIATFADNPVLHQYQLDNGLTLIVKEDHRAPVVISEVWYKVGSGYESLGTTGISHMLEHLMFKGTPKYPDNEFLTLVSQNGGELNAFTTRDFTTYYEMLSADKLPLSFELEADRMANLSLDGKTFDSEHQVVKEERQLRTANDPQALTYERFNAIALPASPYQNPTVGWPSDLDNMTNIDAKHWYHHWYGPNNAILVVVGDVNPEQVYALAKQYFGSIKPITLLPVKPLHTLKALGVKKVIVKAPAKLPYLIMGFNTPSVASASDTKDAWKPYALEVLSGILAGGDSARLEKDLVRDKQIASDIDINYDMYTRLPGLFIIGGTPAQGHTLSQLKQAIMDEITQIQHTPVDEEELSRIKTQVIANNIYAQDSISFQAYLIGSMVSVGLPVTEVSHYESAIREVTPEQVQAVAKEYLKPDHLTLGELVPLVKKDMPATSGSSGLQGATHVE